MTQTLNPAIEGRLVTLETLVLATYVMLFRSAGATGTGFDPADNDFRASILSALEDVREPEVKQAAERAAQSFLAALRRDLARRVN